MISDRLLKLMVLIFGLWFLTMLSLVVIGNTEFSDEITPQQQCIKLGGVPIFDGHTLKMCQFKETPK